MKERVSKVEKEKIAGIVEQRLADARQASRLTNRLRQIALLCRLFNKKAEITYETEKREVKTIIARIWLATQNKIVLKEGDSIATLSIRKVKPL